MPWRSGCRSSGSPVISMTRMARRWPTCTRRCSSAWRYSMLQSPGSAAVPTRQVRRVTWPQRTCCTCSMDLASTPGCDSTRCSRPIVTSAACCNDRHAHGSRRRDESSCAVLGSAAAAGVPAGGTGAAVPDDTGAIHRADRVGGDPRLRELAAVPAVAPAAARLPHAGGAADDADPGLCRGAAGAVDPGAGAGRVDLGLPDDHEISGPGTAGGAELPGPHPLGRPEDPGHDGQLRDRPFGADAAGERVAVELGFRPGAHPRQRRPHYRATVLDAADAVLLFS